jgi:hypothetical protein
MISTATPYWFKRQVALVHQVKFAKRSHMLYQSLTIGGLSKSFN